MLLGRRDPPTWTERVAVMLWPRRSWRRSIRYALLRLKRLDATLHALGLGVGIGVFMSFQPIVGIQMLIAGLLAWFLGASVAAAMIGTFVGTPATWPVMWIASYKLGAWLVGQPGAVTTADVWQAIAGQGAAASIAHSTAYQSSSGMVWQILWPLAVGAVPLGLLAGAGFYVMVMRASTYRSR